MENAHGLTPESTYGQVAVPRRRWGTRQVVLSSVIVKAELGQKVRKPPIELESPSLYC
jgi:hypothetical protein